MATASEVARSHYRARKRLVRATSAAVRALWRRVDSDDIAGSWSGHLARVEAIVRGAQLEAARTADDYVSSVLDAQGVDVAPLGEVRPAAFAESASDGRPLDTLLERPVVAAKVALSQGKTLRHSMATGLATLDMIARTQVEDAGRVADGVAVMARPGIGYVRLVIPPACSRCLILAGRYYRANAGFLRHPDCDCISVPAQGEEAARDEGLVDDPRAYFDSLTPSEQDRVFTKAGAQAIRDGADIAQVVNARRGLYLAGGRTLTTEGTSRRGFARFRLGDSQQRLMPEEIYRTTRSRDEALAALRANGFLL